MALLRSRSWPALLLAFLLAGCLSYGLDAEYSDIDPFSDEATNFIVIGDWGRNGFFGQRDVARAMGVVAEDNAVDFIVSTGDNFYNSGVSSVRDGQWWRSFEGIYVAPALHVPWYPILGNHDHQGSVDAQVAYTEISDRWTMPARYYARTEPTSDSTDVLFVFLDTTPMVESPAGFDASDWNPAGQLRWLDSTLAATDARWRIVVGHHPIYSAGAKQQSNPVLVENLLPLLQAHDVDAYIAGHAHNLQHLEDGDDLHFFVSGAGSMTRPVTPNERTRYAEETKGFMAVSVTPDAMAVRFLDRRGRLRHSVTIDADAPVEAPSAQPVGAVGGPPAAGGTEH